MTGFRFDNVSLDYGDLVAVSELTFEVVRGETICLLGPSGCGKTTTLRLLAGVETPMSGRITIGETLVSDRQFVLPPEKRGIGFLFQEYALFPHLTVLDNVLFGLADRKSQAAKNRAIELLSKTGVVKLSDSYPTNLSGGEQQRIALARALAPSPRLILMDEPFSSLDTQLRDNMRKLTLDLLHEVDMTSLIVTHDADDALRMADKVAVMRDGRIVQFDNPENIYANPSDGMVAGLFGRVNSMRALRQSNMIKSSFGQLRDEGVEGFVSLMVRPHDIALEADEAGGSKAVHFQALVTRVRKIGYDTFVDIKLDDDSFWEVQLRGGYAPEEKSQATFHINPKNLMIFDV